MTAKDLEDIGLSAGSTAQNPHAVHKPLRDSEPLRRIQTEHPKDEAIVLAFSGRRIDLRISLRLVCDSERSWIGIREHWGEFT